MLEIGPFVATTDEKGRGDDDNWRWELDIVFLAVCCYSHTERGRGGGAT